MSTLSAREFNQDVSAAKRATSEGPVVITDRGQPSHVLMSYEEFARLTGRASNLVDWLAMDDDDIGFDPPPMNVGLRAAEL